MGWDIDKIQQTIDYQDQKKLPDSYFLLGAENQSSIFLTSFEGTGPEVTSLTLHLSSPTDFLWVLITYV